MKTETNRHRNRSAPAPSRRHSCSIPAKKIKSLVVIRYSLLNLAALLTKIPGVIGFIECEETYLKMYMSSKVLSHFLRDVVCHSIWSHWRIAVN